MERQLRGTANAAGAGSAWDPSRNPAADPNHAGKRRPKGLTKADPEARKAKILIKQNFSAVKPFQKLLTDITQVQCADGKLYISPILDCFNGEILSLCMANNMRKELCINTVTTAAGRFPIRGAILHSDRGSQYTSEAFRRTLTATGLVQSLSGVAHCYDNARMESFFATLKIEEGTDLLNPGVSDADG